MSFTDVCYKLLIRAPVMALSDGILSAQATCIFFIANNYNKKSLPFLFKRKVLLLHNECHTFLFYACFTVCRS